MRDINALDLNQVSGGTIFCGEMISSSVLHNIHREAIWDARKMGSLVGTIAGGVAAVAFNAGLMGFPAAVFGTVAAASVVYNLEYTSSMRVLDYNQEIFLG